MSTDNTEVITSSKDEVLSLDERIVNCYDEKLIYVRRGSQKDNNRVVGKDNLNFNNSHLSKEHACFKYKHGTLYVKDCGSTFGTTVNDRFVIADIWHALKPCDTIGFIVSKPSTWITKIVSKFPDHDDIPLDEFSNPPIGLKLRFTYLDGNIRFNIVGDESRSKSLSDDTPTDMNANETYDTDGYYFDDCLEVDKNRSEECTCAERSFPEGNDDEIIEVYTNTVESGPKLDNNSESTDKQEECIARMEISLLDCKDSDGNAHLDIKGPHLEISNTHDTHDALGAKSEDLDDDEDSSFGHFTSELISGSELVSELDSLSGLSSSVSDSSSSLSSSSSSSSSLSSSSSSCSSSSASESDDSEPELDTSVHIKNIDEDLHDEDCSDHHSGWICEKIFDFTDSDSQESTIGGLSDACVPILNRAEGCLSESNDSESFSAENRRKRSYDEYQDDLISSQAEHESKKIKLSSTEDTFTFKNIVKEVSKGVLYAMATIAALGVYGSTIDNQD